MIPKELCVTFIFESEEEKHYFLGQLSDGWGENHVDLDWDEAENLYDATFVEVRVIDEDFEGAEE